MSILEENLNLIMLRPYRKGLIPVVLVHGTGSSAGRWAQLINELDNDPRIRRRFQLWLFSYNSDNPIALSAAELRDALTDAIGTLDSEGQDTALRRMVVIGHSQGGLLAKLTAVDSGDRFWQNLSDVSFEEIKLRPETRELLEKALFLKPLPAVARLIFLATPHRGSYLTRVRLAGWSPSDFVSNLIELPSNLTQTLADLSSALVLRDPDARALLKLERIPTSIDNMTPGNPFLQTLAELPIAPHVEFHSIIAVEGDGPPEKGGDGVVKYSSAHLDGVASELVVRSAHSMQGQPETIEEVRRILLLHPE
jgi:pimeloyl-ACP methyl ester carboxylesterase